ncbi:MAG: stage V sporulation protein AB [Lachnospiraceae bacterium]|nr:stage V sporulation protein AB [Lachnospiraceae bacterium]
MRYILLVISGLSAGFLTAAAYVAFIAMLGVFPKIAAKTNTAKQCMLYENCLMLGILLATFLQFCVSFYSSSLPQIALLPSFSGSLVLIFIGLFGGIYIGFLIGGLSEVLNVIPTYARKANIQKRVGLLIIFLALGKGVFSLIYFLYLTS